MIIKQNEDELCVAIIMCGLKDLKHVLKKCKQSRRNKRKLYQDRVEAIKRELRSEWCRSLTELDIDYLIKGVIDENKRVSRTNKKI